MVVGIPHSCWQLAWYGHGAIFKMLLEREDIDVNCKDGDGDTALSGAIWNRQAKIIRLLLAKNDLIIDEDIDFESSTDLSQSIKDELAARRSNTAKGFKAVGVDCVPSEGSAFLVGETEM
ncbi:hypothetical protein P167DRAFT_575590 [Morchella conica CCBAS932]|uniref:Ankyrin n=1 Tax=Morchella conica CCBAS932 TaxID=1392247 RepID=A0A3N4KNH6_9PEZI|nr:hypothetical protein P167DRAFT_575590 [Morchella conica CCBAS932]